jgi:hypothetical protein
MDLPFFSGINYFYPGIAEKSIQIFDGKIGNKDAKYSFAIGTNDKQPIVSIIG